MLAVQRLVPAQAGFQTLRVMAERRERPSSRQRRQLASRRLLHQLGLPLLSTLLAQRLGLLLLRLLQAVLQAPVQFLVPWHLLILLERAQLLVPLLLLLYLLWAILMRLQLRCALFQVLAVLLPAVYQADPACLLLGEGPFEPPAAGC